MLIMAHGAPRAMNLFQGDYITVACRRAMRRLIPLILSSSLAAHEHRSHGRAVTVLQFQGQADQLIFSRLDAGEVQTFHGYDAIAQENLMCGDTAFERAHREVIDADELNAVLDDPICA